MSGSIWFRDGAWPHRDSPIRYVLEFLSERLPPSGVRDQVRENIAMDAPYLHLEEPEHAPAVDLIAEELPRRLSELADAERRGALELAFRDLIEHARAQRVLRG